MLVIKIRKCQGKINDTHLLHGLGRLMKTNQRFRFKATNKKLGYNVGSLFRDAAFLGFTRGPDSVEFGYG